MSVRTAILTVLLLCSSAAAWAQPRPVVPGPAPGAAALPVPTPVGDKRFQAWLNQGREALGRKDIPTALKAFEDAFRYSPKPVLLYFLGKVAQEQQRSAAAFDLYRRYLEATLDEADPELRADALQLLQSPHEVGCEVTVQGDGGALLSVDGRLAGLLPLATPLRLTAGAHQLLLEKGRRRVETQVTLAPRRQAEVRFTLVPPLALLTLTPGVLLTTQPSPLEPTLAQAVRRTVSEAAGQQNAVLISPETQADVLVSWPELLGCLDQLRCQEQLAQQTAAQFALRLSIAAPGLPSNKGPGSTFQFSGEMLDVDVGVVSVRASQTCGDCNVKRAMQMLAEMVQEMLRQAASRPRGTIKLTSEPPGARVEVDGRDLGETPYLRDAFVGPHDLLVKKQGFTAQRLVATVEDGQTAELSATLLADKAVPARKLPGVRIAKWVLLGVGAVTVIGGITLLALTGSQNCSGPAASPVCSQPFDGRPSGIPLVSIGSLALGTSAFLFIYDARQNAATPTPAATAGLGTTVHF